MTERPPAPATGGAPRAREDRPPPASSKVADARSRERPIDVPRPADGLGIVRMFRLSRDPLGFLTALRREHGTFVRYRLGPRVLHLASDPDLVHEVLVAKARSFHKDRGTEMMQPLLGRGLLTSEDEQHKRQRRAVQPAFHQSRIAGYAGIMVSHALRARDELRDGETVDLFALAMRTTFAIVGRALFDADVAGDADAVRQGLAEAMSMFTLARVPVFRLLLALPLPSSFRFARARAQLQAVVDRIVREHRQAKRDGLADEGRTRRADVLSMLMLAQDGELSDTELRDTSLTLLLAGHETTAVALCWTLYLLSQHPGIEARVHAELDSTLRGETPSAKDLDGLPYLHDVISESMRLYPPAWAVGRLAQEDVQLGDRVVRRGETVILSQWVIHRDAALWRDPLRFDPERFQEVEQAARHRFAYFPFGAGPRVCIGEGFAWTELLLVLATLAQKFRFRLAAGQVVEPLPRVTLRLRHGLRMVVEERASFRLAGARQAVR